MQDAAAHPCRSCRQCACLVSGSRLARRLLSSGDFPLMVRPLSCGSTQPFGMGTAGEPRRPRNERRKRGCSGEAAPGQGERRGVSRRASGLHFPWTPRRPIAGHVPAPGNGTAARDEFVSESRQVNKELSDRRIDTGAIERWYYQARVKAGRVSDAGRPADNDIRMSFPSDECQSSRTRCRDAGALRRPPTT